MAQPLKHKDFVRHPAAALDCNNCLRLPSMWQIFATFMVAFLGGSSKLNIFITSSWHKIFAAKIDFQSLLLKIVKQLYFLLDVYGTGCSKRHRK